MGITIDDILAAMQAATADKVQAVKEFVAPEAKQARLLATADHLTQQIAKSNENAIIFVDAFRAKVLAGDLSVVEPSWDDVAEAFHGS